MAPNVGLGTQGPVQRGWGLWLTSVLAVVIAALFVAARLGQRLTKRSGFGMDDYMIIVALICSGLLSLTECQAVVYGYGRHWTSLPHDSRMTARKWFYGANIMYKVVLMFNKISVVCLYYRIFSVSTRYFRIVCHVMNGWIISSGLAFIIATVFQCTPVAAFWDRSIPGFKCFKNEPWWISYATTQITTDFMLLAMPIRQILLLSMGRAEKLGICLVFGTGAFVTFASIYRATTIASSASNPDPTWGPVPATIWSVIEANTGIICACLPMLRAPFVRLFGPLLGSHTRRGSTGRRPSHQLTWGSGQPRLGSHKTDVSHVLPAIDRDSEEGIVKDEDILADGRAISHSRRGSGIFVTNEFSVVTELEKKKRQSQCDGQDGDTLATSSVNEDKTDGKSPFYHV
ncbi:uncharacterized protein K460DRAFT_312988 [Cucurbitaria berberidis CBS 394.84]|uniref:Rhodopsin domain-containing protein n=1 Tax=Cucurbitaria berberidis CBS 394.84 TaxID=1168544 RepID=A0A9P4GIR8_9PLEO|nr:uncharacterized protein K460DRAFT_312988 [Cucurbitaria berberidis CBS 394.84]KAF1845979.1 hypothetical protein K460DRAFT_312988 [Cucurbitaria berberidis CBS 394.84]